MKDTTTLSEVCSVLEVSRRAVQGYENAGLVSATGKNISLNRNSYGMHFGILKLSEMQNRFLLR